MRAVLVRTALSYLVWLVLVEARPGFLLLGVPACLAVAFAMGPIGRASAHTIGPARLLAYIPGFLWRSLQGGIDVAGRVLRPSLPLRPGFRVHRFREQDKAVQVVFCDVLTLMPGSLVVGIDGSRALIHVLADEAATRRLIAQEAARTARLYGLDEPGVPTTSGSPT